MNREFNSFKNISSAWKLENNNRILAAYLPNYAIHPKIKIVVLIFIHLHFIERLI